MKDLKESDVDFYIWITDVNVANTYTGMDPLGIVPSEGGACDDYSYQKTTLVKGPSEGVMSTARVN